MAALLCPLTAFAQAPTEVPEPPATAAPSATPETPPKTPPEAPKPEEPAFFRKTTFGIGAGMVFWPPSNDIEGDEVDIAPALTFQLRKAVPLAGVFGFEFTTDVVFHDFKAMGDAYNWYFKPSTNAEGEDLQPTKLLLLWPGLIFIPFGAANYTTGFGLVVWTAKSVPSMYFDGGLNLNLFLRLSDPQFRADFGFGAYGGLGLDLFKNLGMNLRFTWGAPFVHTLIKKTSSGITTVMLNINFAH